MGGATVIVLFTVIAQAHAKDFMNNVDNQIVDKLADRLIDKFLDVVLKQSPSDHADLDGTTLSGTIPSSLSTLRTHPGMSRGNSLTRPFGFFPYNPTSYGTQVLRSMQPVRALPASQQVQTGESPELPFQRRPVLGALMGASVLGGALSAEAEIEPLKEKIDPQKAMGTWYIQRQIPALDALEKNAYNPTEVYTFNTATNQVEVTYTLNDGAPDGKLVTVKQTATVQNAEGTSWALTPNLGGFSPPIKLPYFIIDFDNKDYSYLTCTGGLKSWVYIFTKAKNPDAALMDKLVKRVGDLGFDVSKLQNMAPRQGA